MNRISAVAIVAIAIMIGGCVTIGNKTFSKKQQSILDMKSEALSDLFKVKPDVKSQISSAYGYAVFSNININVIFASFGGGRGVVKNNKTGKHTFMKMGEVGIGIGMGVKDFRAVFVFHSTDSMNRFIEDGWAFGAQADVAAKANEKGEAFSGEAIIDNISVYQLTKNGLALQATVKGTKFWKDDSLNSHNPYAPRNQF